MAEIKKIAMLTGGGDCPGLNAVIRAIVRTAASYGYQVIGYADGYRGLVENEFRAFSSADVAGLLDRGGTVLGTSNRHDPFRYKQADGTYQDMSARVLANLRAAAVDALIVIGGDGTMISAHRYHQLGVPVVGVPKTIDNDLPGTDYTFGFQTAVATATEAIDKLHSTAESHHRIMVLEVMGRYAGWIALTAGLAGGADIILIPEIPYQISSVAAAIQQRRATGKHFSIVVVAEGAKAEGGELVVRQLDRESPEPVRLGGIGAVLAEQLESLTGIESRVTVLGHLQRGGRPIPYDRILSTRFGAAAVEAVADGDFGVMVALSGQQIIRLPLASLAGKQRLVPPDHPYLRLGREMGVHFGEGS